MKSLKISTELHLPLEAVTQTFVVYGGKGMGKTNFGSVFCEELSRVKLRFSYLDPVGVTWGLRSSADGKHEGLDVLILGGVHADIPIDPTAGALVADFVVDESVNVIIDISRHSNGKMWGKREKIRFVTEYSNRLFERQGEKREPLMQIYDEAGRFIPQVIPHGAVDIAECTGAIEQLVELGRNVGVGVLLMTQRSARMNKSVSELADIMISFRTIGPNSLGAVSEWLSEKIEKESRKAIIDQIRSLPIGKAMIVSPGWLEIERAVQIRARETFDSSATPRPGKFIKAPTRRAEIDVGKYREHFSATIAKAKEGDPNALRARIKELEKQLRAQPKPVASASVETKIGRVEVPILKPAQVKALESAAARFEGEHEKLALVLNNKLEKLRAAAQEVRGLLQAAKSFQNSSIVSPGTSAKSFHRVETAKAEHAVAPKVASALISEDNDEFKLDKAKRAILIALAQHPDGLNKRQIAVMAGYAMKGGAFNNAFSYLKVREAFASSGGHFAITSIGLKALGESWQPLPQGDELFQYWMNQLDQAAREILRVLYENHPKEMSKPEIAALTNSSTGGPYEAAGGAFNNALSKLRTLMLIEGRQRMKACEEFFV